ncbi:MAG: DNA polymerase III subunit alpha, partial [Bacteroidetes bacterium]
MSKFTHLHVHTQYSILDGASSIPGLIEKVKADGMKALAITEHGNMFGVKQFHDKATKAGIKPIIGCEAYVAINSRFDRDKIIDKKRNHLIILAKNKTGYHNLVKLISYAWLEGNYYKPRIDEDLLFELHEGLIISSACLGGKIPRLIREGKM